MGLENDFEIVQNNSLKDENTVFIQSVEHDENTTLSVNVRLNNIIKFFQK